MNYRHSFHAGNFADVVKHAVVTRVIEYLKRKDKAFRVIDTHAGAGLYDLFGDEARKTGEWQGGIGRLLAAEMPEKIASLLKPLCDSIAAVNQDGELRFYPGSPMIARNLARPQDRLTAIELHPQDAEMLRGNFAGDHQVRVIELDGWLALGAHLPPKEKRGLVLIDPPFEAEGEFDRILTGLKKAYRRWPGGIYAVWYPIKDRAAVAAFRAALQASGIADVLDVRLEIRAASSEPRLDGTGMVLVNPPFVLREELEAMLPFLAQLLGDSGNGRFALDQLIPE